jgi:hypothetical protein
LTDSLASAKLLVRRLTHHFSVMGMTERIALFSEATSLHFSLATSSCQHLEIQLNQSPGGVEFCSTDKRPTHESLTTLPFCLAIARIWALPSCRPRACRPRVVLPARTLFCHFSPPRPPFAGMATPFRASSSRHLSSSNSTCLLRDRRSRFAISANRNLRLADIRTSSATRGSVMTYKEK